MVSILVTTNLPLGASLLKNSTNRSKNSITQIKYALQVYGLKLPAIRLQYRDTIADSCLVYKITLTIEATS